MEFRYGYQARHEYSDWKKIDDLIAKIRHRAAEANEQETYRDADNANGLLRNLANEIAIEDDHQA